ncbi:hypothetical protein [Qipengyuania sphaerica]|uniref:hypothetical protein n=1 Tax=Qipengyuania sphaerica TaxID=2867243 RepID=UPI001C87883A|nr:hypothetical protein [Qipengyuania sphaerica]MBX7540195.1 hypothetical protein [Qipengyuania sphaerica]
MSLFSNRHSEEAVDRFAKQFTLEGGRWVYRRNRKEEPRPVEQAEVEQFVETYRKQLTLTSWGGAAIFMVTLMVLTMFPTQEVDMSVYLLTFAAELAVFAFIQIRAWSEPARQLDRRPVVGMALSSREHAARTLADVTYGRLLILIMVGASIGYGGYINIGSGDRHWWLWMGVGVLCAVFGTIQILRKFLVSEDQR